MNQTKTTYLTKEGLVKLKEELDHLVKVERKIVITRIKEARELGDLSENAEYAEAREQQAMIEGRIEDIEQILKKAKIIDHSLNKKQQLVSLGSKITCQVKFQDEKDSETQVFYIVGSAESNPSQGLISAESPTGSSLLGAKVGDKVTVPVPDDGVVVYTIKAIE